MTSIAWDGSVTIPIARKTIEYLDVERKSRSLLRPYSDTWWVVYDEIEAENDGQVTSEASGLPSVISQNNEATARSAEGDPVTFD